METPVKIKKKPDSEKPYETFPKSNIPRLSSPNTLSTNKSRSVSLKQDVARLKKKEKPVEPEKNKTEINKESNKSKEEKKGLEIQTCIPVRDRGKNLFRGKFQDKRKKSRDYQQFRAEFNASAGNILKDWMSLIYCVLVLRMNLIKFILEQMPRNGSGEINFQKQILVESKTIYDIIKHAQTLSQEKFFLMWKELERLIFSYVMLKNNLGNKKQMLVKTQNNMNKLKISQNKMLKTYTAKIEALMSQIEEKEEEIKVEKEENRKIKTDLAEWFGDSEEK